MAMSGGDARAGAAGPRRTSVVAARGAPYFTPNSSTSKISVALGGMTPPAPRAP